MNSNMDLDRFSRKMPWENESLDFAEDNYTEDEMPICCGCGIEIDFDEAKVESEYYADEFMHEDTECISQYYKKIGQELCFATAKFREIV